MKKMCFIFVYGRLEVGEDLSPKVVESSTKDTIQAEMYDLKDYPACINIGNSTHYAKGETLEIPEDELAGLDEAEGSDDYKRIKVTTALGYEAWVYEYIKKIPEDAKLITSWEDSDDSKPYKSK